MIRHIVWWTLKDFAEGRTADENAWHILQASATLHGLPSVMSVEVSSKVEPSTTVPAKVVLMSTHKDMKALEEYRVDPVHQEFAKMIGALAESRQCIDYGVLEDD